MDAIVQWVIATFGGMAIAGLVGLIATYIKKGDVKNWGIACGKALSKFADAKLGKDRWEKLEDSVTIAVVSFATGFKEGADYDDNEIDALKADKNNVGKLKQVLNKTN